MYIVLISFYHVYYLHLVGNMLMNFYRKTNFVTLLVGLNFGYVISFDLEKFLNSLQLWIGFLEDDWRILSTLTSSMASFIYEFIVE